MHRILYVFLPEWPIDQLRRAGLPPSSDSGAVSAEDELSFPRKRESRACPGLDPGASDERSPWTPAGVYPRAAHGADPGAGVTNERGEESPFATVIAAGGRRLVAAVNPAAVAKGIAPG